MNRTKYDAWADYRALYLMKTRGYSIIKAKYTAWKELNEA